MEDNIQRFMRRDADNRVLVKDSKSGLFECLSQHVFIVPLEDFQSTFKSFMQRDEEKLLFCNILQLLDNTGKVPVKKEQESDGDFRKRMDECYDKLVNTCTNIHPYSDFLHVYVFAVATLVGRPIYVLHEDESGELSWSYFPILYSHTFDGVRNDTRYSIHQYITLFFSTDDCFMIDSKYASNEPVSMGCIGTYLKLSKAILLSPEVSKICVEQMVKSIQRPEVQLSLRGVLTHSITQQCLQLFEESITEIVYRRHNAVPLRRQLSLHRPNKEEFIAELVSNTYLVQCLYQASVEDVEGYKIWECVVSGEDFKPSVFRGKLHQLERAILELDNMAADFVVKCSATSDELSGRREKVNKAVIGGSGVGILGGVLAIVGLALTPVTFGASLGLTIAGASIGAIGGAAGGAYRAFEGVKQNTSIDEIKQMKHSVAEHENNFIELIRDLETMIRINSDKYLEHTVNVPGINQRGFLAIGSALRSLHGGIAIGLAALKVGAVGASVAASVLGPLSLALDIGFLAEAAHNLRKGCKTGAGTILEQNAKAVEMKMEFFMCMIRGNIKKSRYIVE